MSRGLRRRLDRLEPTSRQGEALVIEVWTEDPDAAVMVGPGKRRLSMTDYEAYRQARREKAARLADAVHLIEVRYAPR